MLRSLEEHGQAERPPDHEVHLGHMDRGIIMTSINMSISMISVTMNIVMFIL